MPETENNGEDAIPTYADALEEVYKTSLSYHTKGRMAPISCCAWFGCTALTLLFLIPAITMLFLVLARDRYSPSGFAETSLIIFCIYLLPPFLGWTVIALTRIRRVLRMENGVITLYRLLIPYARIAVSDILWIGTVKTARFLFLTRGRRIGIPVSFRAKDLKSEYRMLDMLFELGRQKIKEEVSNVLETGSPVLPIPLNEGATRRRLPGMAKGFLLLLPFTALLLFAGISFIVLGIKERADSFSIFFFLFVPVFLVLGIYFLVLFFKGMKRAISTYGYAREEFRKTGYRIHEVEIPFADMRITLYRGIGNIDDPDPGVLEILISEKTPIYIGPERQNFFVLPYVLLEWAGDSFSIEPIDHAPEGARGIPFYDRLWQPPEGSIRLFGQRRG
ncbi:MAG: hypothetical protein ACYS8W_05550 [Planctomycetota bacterium]|jgi:hypothetical protein